MKYTFTILVLLFTVALLKAQTGPNLTAGASGVVFNKGQLDAQLIAEIIATKRGEIKSELAKRLILNKFRCGNLATYNYVHNTVNILLDETNKDVMSKRLLENSAELLMVYGFSEFYLRELANRRSSLGNEERKFLTELGFWSAKDNYEIIDSTFSIKVASRNGEVTKSQEGHATFLRSISPVGLSGADLSSMDNIRFLPMFVNKSKSYSEAKGHCDNLSMVHVYVDMVFEILRSNKHVRNVGFFKSISLDDHTYKSVSKIYRVQNLGSESTNYGPEIARNIMGADSAVYKSIQNRVEHIFQFYNTLQSLVKRVGKDQTGINSGLLNSIKDQLKNFEVPAKAEEFLATVDQLKLKVTEVAIPLDRAQLPELSSEEKNLIVTLSQFVNSLKVDFARDVKDLEGFRLYIENDLMPQLIVLNQRTFGAYSDILKLLDTISGLIELRGLAGIIYRMDDSVSGRQVNKDTRKFFENYKLYFEVVNVINNLDKVESYDKCFNYLMNIFNTFGNEKTKNVAHALTSAYDKYTVLNVEENKLILDVESMAVDVYERYGENNSHLIGIYFSVGINYAFNFKGATFNLDEQTIPGKFSYVSEKIGVAMKLADFDKQYSFGKRQFKPLINNIHAIGYLSGLLYQIEFLNSNDQFKSPLYGFGVGITSFNGLDLNITYAVPFENDIQHGLWNVGLDIKITEYLSAKRKKG